MSWTYINYCKGEVNPSGTIVNGDAVLNIAAGDLIVALWRWYGNDTTCTLSDGGSNDLTITAHQYISSDRHGYAYKLAATANASATFTLTLADARLYRAFILLQFRPSAGTVTLDAYDLLKTATSAAVLTNDITTTGYDELVIGGRMIDSSTGQTISDTQIGDVASDGCPWSGPSPSESLWYKVFTSPQSNIHAQGTLSGSERWGAGILSFKLEGGGSVVPKIMQNMNQFNGGMI